MDIDIDIAVVGSRAHRPCRRACARPWRRARGADRAGRRPRARPQPLDTRTAALLESSVDMLKALGVWEALLPHAAPLKAIRIIDASGSLFRAPDVEFRASELGLDAFGYNIANTALIDVLYARLPAALPALYPSNVERVALDAEPRPVERHARLRRFAARLVAGADGRNSICREGCRDRRLRAGLTGRPRSPRASPIARRIAASRSSSTARAARSPPCR